MIAVDTNVVVRYLARDDEFQAQQARMALESAETHIPTTVLLETEWVLRRSYGFDRTMILDAMQRLLGLPNVRLGDPTIVQGTLELFQLGFDFADAMHLASGPDHATFLTFDRSLIRTAQKRKVAQVKAPGARS